MVNALISFEKIQELVQTIVNQFQPKAIYLFGSYAYGQPTLDSDIDLLVLMASPDPDKPAYRWAPKIRLTLPRDLAIDILVREPEEFDRRVKGFDGFCSTIAEQGVLLYHQEGQP